MDSVRPRSREVEAFGRLWPGGGGNDGREGRRRTVLAGYVEKLELVARTICNEVVEISVERAVETV